MASKFEGFWQLHFLTTDQTGNITRTPMGKIHLKTIENNGNIKEAKDKDGNNLSGKISKGGPFETIHLKWEAGHQRHLRGILAFEDVINGVFCMVLTGERRPTPFPEGFREKDKTDPLALPGQEDGTWVATKP